MARSSRKRNTHTVDMTGVDWKSGGGSFHITPGDYPMKVTKVEFTQSKADNDMFVFQFEGTGGKAKGKAFYMHCTLTEKSLWKLGQTLDALGVEVPNGPMEIDCDELVDLECTGIVEDDEYEGKVRSKLDRIIAGNGEEDEKPARRKGNGKKAEVKFDEKEVGQMTEEELEDIISDHKLDIDLGNHKTLRRKAAAVVEALDGKGLIA